MYSALEKLLIVLLFIVGVALIATDTERGQPMNFAYKITDDMNVTTTQTDNIINEVQKKVKLS